MPKAFEFIHRKLPRSFVHRILPAHLRDRSKPKTPPQDVFVVFCKSIPFEANQRFHRGLPLGNEHRSYALRRNKHRWILLESAEEMTRLCIEISAPDVNLAAWLDRIDLNPRLVCCRTATKPRLVLHDVQGYVTAKSPDVRSLD